MNEPRIKPQLLRSLFSGNGVSKAWETCTKRPMILRCQLTDNWLGIPFRAILKIECLEIDESREMTIEWRDSKESRSLFIAGPKVPELFEAISNGQANGIRADGVDITRVDLLA
jgi:hypothetical protein